MNVRGFRGFLGRDSLSSLLVSKLISCTCTITEIKHGKIIVQSYNDTLCGPVGIGLCHVGYIPQSDILHTSSVMWVKHWSHKFVPHNFYHTIYIHYSAWNTRHVNMKECTTLFSWEAVFSWVAYFFSIHTCTNGIMWSCGHQSHVTWGINIP